MRKQDVLGKGCSNCADRSARTDPGQAFCGVLDGAGKRKGHQAGARVENLETELACNTVTEAGRTHFWYRQAAGSNHQSVGSEYALVRCDSEDLVGFNLLNRTVGLDAHVGSVTFALEHCDD